MKFFRKNISTDQQHASWTLTHAHIARLGAGLLMMFFFIFIAGYYWGKKQAVEQLASQFTQDSFADKVYSSLCSLYDVSEDEDKDKEEGDNEGEGESVDGESTEEGESEPEKLYCAPLSSYATYAQAEAYNKKLLARSIPTRIVTRVSSSARGKKMTLYQVVTQPLPLEKLEQCVAQIKKVDHLKDIKIMCCEDATIKGTCV